MNVQYLNIKIQKPASLKFEPKVLPITNQKLLKTETFLQKIWRNGFWICWHGGEETRSGASDRTQWWGRYKIQVSIDEAGKST